MISILEKSKKINELINNINAKNFPLSLQGFTEDILHRLALQNYLSDENQVIVYSEKNLAKKVFEKLSYTSENIYLIEEKDLNFLDLYSYNRDSEISRLEAIYRLIFAKGNIFITTVDACISKTQNIEFYKENYLELLLDNEIDYDYFLDTLVNFGYERIEQVEKKAQFSARGSIVDIFPMGYDYPLRIEFFGDEVYMIRKFDLDTQRSENSNEIKNIIIRPASEAVISKEQKETAYQKLKNYDIKNLSDKQISRYEKTLKYFSKDEDEDFIYKYISFVDSADSCLLDFLENSLLLFSDFHGVLRSIYQKEEIWKKMFQIQIERNAVLSEQFNLQISSKEFLDKVREKNLLSFSNISSSNKEIKFKSNIITDFREQRNFLSDLASFAKTIKDFQEENYKSIISIDNSRDVDEIIMYLEEENISYIYHQDELDLNEFFNSLNPLVLLIKNKNHLSFSSKEMMLSVFKDSDIFQKSNRVRKGVLSSKKRIKSFNELNVGDYVAHYTHGVAEYLGVFKIETLGEENDMIKLRYQNDDYLYVPVHRMDTLYKYASSSAVGISVDNLSGVSWLRRKSRVRKKLDEIADELVKLYAARQNTKGFQFSKDTDWQIDFEDSFEYIETKGQLDAIEDIKKDMEKPIPMERLLIADVGFGKTEVAIRAIFKAMMDDKQVAFLVPTTILAKQHYINIKKRMKDYPFEIEQLTRFKTRKEQEEIKARLENGQIDLIVGTHAILSKSVKFKNLGLLLIDEEQKFGVKSKEKLKELKLEVDTLMLSATPIPRTLNMGMLGIKDLSVITDPPQGRVPVTTYVLEHDDEIVREAILKEVSRSGQVFFVHNRVRDIDFIADKVQKLVPEIAVGVVHGQLKPRHIENIIVDFMDKKFEVLVASSIIENGMDIPSVNTIIINECNNFGLSQLYQLRGRVGRSDVPSYAYLMYNSKTSLSEIAIKRLKAIKEFSDLNSSFKLSSADLEIRGSGNLLGVSQSGHLSLIGHEMYMKLLEEAILESKGDTSSSIDTTVDFSCSSYLPDSFISNENFKMEIYKKISFIENEDEKNTLYSEIEDRFGTPPKELCNLLYISVIRKYASKLKITAITEKLDIVRMFLDTSFVLDLKLKEKIRERNYQEQIKFLSNKQSIIELNYTKLQLEKIDILDKTLKFLSDLLYKL